MHAFGSHARLGQGQFLVAEADESDGSFLRLTPAIAGFLEAKHAHVPADRFWDQWRARQRIEQYQDTILMLGHSGYLETARPA